MLRNIPDGRSVDVEGTHVKGARGQWTPFASSISGPPSAGIPSVRTPGGCAVSTDCGTGMVGAAPVGGGILGTREYQPHQHVPHD